MGTTQLTKFHPVLVGASFGTPQKVKNTSGNTVYYKNDPNPSATHNDGSLAVGESVTITNNTWFVTAEETDTEFNVEARPTGPNLTEVYGPIVGTGNVLFHGADPTGTKDSTEAFKSTLAASKVAYAPEGTYLIEGTMDVTGKTFIGDGMGRTVLTKNGTSSAMLTVTPTEGTSTAIKGFTLTNENHSATEGSYIKVEAATEVIQAPVKIEDIETKYAFHGLEFGLCLLPLIDKLYQYKWKGNAVWCHSGANGCAFNQFVFQEGSNTSVGIRLEGKTPAHVFVNGEVFSCGVCLYASIEGGNFEAHQPEHCRFTDCFFDTGFGKLENKSVATVTEGSALVKMTVARSGINVGNTVTGAGVPASTTISEIKLSTNEIKLSANIEAGKSGTPTLTFTNGTNSPACVVLSQCLDFLLENCWAATAEATAKVTGFLLSSCESTALTQCITFQQYYAGYYITGCLGTALTGCTAIRGATGAEFNGTKVGQVSLAGNSRFTSISGGVYLKSKQYAFVVGELCGKTDINGPAIEVTAGKELLNEANAANIGSVYYRKAGAEGTFEGTEMKPWLVEAKVEVNTSPFAKIHAGNIQWNGIIEVKAAQEVAAGVAFINIPTGSYRPVGSERRMRLAYGKVGEAPKEVWVEVKPNGEVVTMAGSPKIEATNLIYLDEAWYPVQTT